MDSGVEDRMRCFDSGETWWCYRGTEEELETFARERGMDLVDLDMESGDNEHRYGAVFRPHEGLERNTIFRLRPVVASNGIVTYPQIVSGTEGMRPLRFATRPEDGGVVTAAVRTSRAYGSAGYFYFGGNGPAIQSYLHGVGASREIADLDTFRAGASPLYLMTNYGPAASSTTSFDWSAEQVDDFLALGTHVVRAFHSNAEGRFNISFNEPQPGEPARFWVHHLSENELVAATEDRRAHVSKLDVSVFGLSAILTVNATVADPRRAESSRLAAILRASSLTATAGVYSKLLDGEVTHFYNDRYTFAAPSMLMPAIAVRELDSDSALDEMISIPDDGCAANSPANTQETVREAVINALGHRDARRARALIDRYGFSSSQDYVTAMSMPNSVLEAIPGCETSTATSRTTLLDQALMYEYGYHRLITSGNERLLLREAMLGAAGRDDPLQLRAVFDAVLEVELARVGLAKSARFLAETEILYVTADASDKNAVRRAVSGRLRLPRCDGASVEVDAHFFGYFIEGAGDRVLVETALAELANVLMETQTKRALSFGIGCF